MPDAATDAVLLVDEPLARVRRLTLNRPAKRNALNDALRVTTYCGLGTIRRLVERNGARLLPAQLSQGRVEVQPGNLGTAARRGVALHRLNEPIPSKR